MRQKINRRRFITISAAAAGALMSGQTKAAAQGAALVQWHGAALGAEAQINLYTKHPAQAQEIFAMCQLEISRLENIFSLYRKNSAINSLNKQGYLDDPDFEFLDLLSRCLSCYHLTGGAFDVTIQPLWTLYADHFSRPNADPAGPSQDSIKQTLKLVGSDKIRLDPRRISFAQKGMGISLNGVAQGYITDQVTKRLKAAGFENILVYMGETYAMGHHDDGRPWTAGISSPLKDHKIMMTIPLANQALATSGGYGSPFSSQSHLHHILDPKTGTSAYQHGSVSVVAKDTTTADMLSTAFYVLPFDKILGLWPKYPQLERAIFISSTGKIQEISKSEQGILSLR